MTPDLWRSLGGSPPHPDWREPRGRLLATFVSDCGRKLGAVYQEPTFPMAIVNGYRLTRAHTNMVVFDQALLDIETMVESGVRDGYEVVHALVEALNGASHRLPPLAVPEARVDVATLTRQVEEERTAAREGNFKPREFADLATACGKCKRVHYLGDEMAAWWSTPNPRPTVVIVTRLRDLSRHAGWTFPESRLAGRLETYRLLKALL